MAVQTAAMLLAFLEDHDNMQLILAMIVLVLVGLLPIQAHAAAVWRVELPEYQQPKQPVAHWWQQWGGFLFSRAAGSRPAVGTIFTVSSSGYASSPYQTDDTPCITAAGTRVRSGVVASNFLPLGTILSIGEEQYIVEDRMNPRYQGYFIDIWFAKTSDALQHGRRSLEVKIIDYGVPGQEIRRENAGSEQDSDQFEEPGVLQRARLRMLALSRSLGKQLRVTVDPNRFDVDCFAEAEVAES